LLCPNTKAVILSGATAGSEVEGSAFLAPVHHYSFYPGRLRLASRLISVLIADVPQQIDAFDSDHHPHNCGDDATPAQISAMRRTFIGTPPGLTDYSWHHSTGSVDE
jgi:hypothetical protein